MLTGRGGREDRITPDTIRTTRAAIQAFFRMEVITSAAIFPDNVKKANTNPKRERRGLRAQDTLCGAMERDREVERRRTTRNCGYGRIRWMKRIRTIPNLRPIPLEPRTALPFFSCLFAFLVAILLLSDTGREPQETREDTKRKSAQPASFVRIRSIRGICRIRSSFSSIGGRLSAHRGAKRVVRPGFASRSPACPGACASGLYSRTRMPGFLAAPGDTGPRYRRPPATTMLPVAASV
jgi:hypothetical protein